MASQDNDEPPEDSLGDRQGRPPAPPKRPPRPGRQDSIGVEVHPPKRPPRNVLKATADGAKPGVEVKERRAYASGSAGVLNAQAIEAVNAIGNERLREVAAAVLEVLISGEVESFNEWLKRVQERRESEDNKIGAKVLLEFYTQASKFIYSPEQLNKVAQAMGFNADSTLILVESWRESRTAVIKEVTQRSLLVKNELVSVDSRVGFTVCSDEMSSIDRAFVQVNLKVKSCDGNVESHPIEMSVEQFYRFFGEMQLAAQTMNHV